MAISTDYSRMAYPLSPRRPACARAFLAAAAFLIALPVFAQYPGQIDTAQQTGPDLRAVAVLEWTGDPGHPKASRIVPITVWDGQTLQDATIYLARPEPLALEGEVEYQLKQDGKTIGLYDIESAGQQQGTWMGFGAWKPLARPTPPPPPKEFAHSDWGAGDADSGAPVLHRRTPASASGSGSGNGSGNGGSGAQDPDRPTLHRADSSGDNSGNTNSSGNNNSSDQPTLHRADTSDDTADSTNPNAPPIDPDRPVLKEPAKPAPQAKPAAQNNVAYAEALPAISDPSRPRLTRGIPEDSGPAVTPTLVGLPPDMNQSIAVSDAVSHPDHLWNYTWANPDDAATMKSDLEEIARKDLGLVPPPPPAPKKRTTSHKKAAPAPPPTPAPLLDEQFRVFELTYGSGATMVFSAHTQGTGAQKKFVTLIAQPDLYGNVTVLLTNTTDAAHLDDTPRMRLIDPVDALADNRGELLFELRGQTMRQFVLYRVLRGQIQKLFTSTVEAYGNTYLPGSVPGAS